VTRYKYGLDLRRVFRPVPGLGVSYVQFPMACAMGYFLSPFGLDVSEELQVTRASGGPDGMGCDSLAGDMIACPTRQGKKSQAGWRGLFSDHTERLNRRDGA
jgi:hypothetical protein